MKNVPGKKKRKKESQGVSFPFNTLPRVLLQQEELVHRDWKARICASDIVVGKLKGVKLCC